jgi:DEAD/DEAH box helicase domain-containing protein
VVKPPPAYPVPAVRPVPPAIIAEKVVADLQARQTETWVQRIDERPARFADWPADLDPRLTAALAKKGIERPYTHQAAAISNAIAGKNTVVVTPTASGKTLCYNVPVLDSIFKDPTTRALYLFPTKALAQDQLDELHGLITTIGADVRTRAGPCGPPATSCLPTRTCFTRPSFPTTRSGCTSSRRSSTW